MASQFPSGGETVIAELSGGTVRVGIAILLVFPALAILAFELSPQTAAIAILLLVMAYVVDSRARAMRLAVNDGGVQVVNFLRSYIFSLDAVLIETEQESSPLQAGDIPAAMNKSETPKVGVLYLSDGSSDRVRVGVVPSYGGRIGEVVEDLKIAVARHRLEPGS